MSIAVVREILTELGLDPKEVTGDAQLAADLDLDSTERVELALEMKRRLGVEVKLETERDYTVADVAELAWAGVAG
jgi:acyl carrier protein